MGSISTITFEGEEKPVPETCQVDPEAAQEAEVKEPSFEDIGLDHLSNSRKKIGRSYGQDHSNHCGKQG